MTPRVLAPASTRLARRPELAPELPIGATEHRVDAGLCRALVGAKRASPPPPCVLGAVERTLAVGGQFLLATNRRTRL